MERIILRGEIIFSMIGNLKIAGNKCSELEHLNESILKLAEEKCKSVREEDAELLE